MEVIKSISKPWNLLTEDELRQAIIERNPILGDELVPAKYEIKVIGRETKDGKGESHVQWVHMSRGNSRVDMAPSEYLRCQFVKARSSELETPESYAANIFENDPLFGIIRSIAKEQMAKDTFQTVMESHRWGNSDGTVVSEDSPTFFLADSNGKSLLKDDVWAGTLSVPRHYITRANKDGLWLKVPQKRTTNK